jgi:hypothetical protein
VASLGALSQAWTEASLPVAGVLRVGINNHLANRPGRARRMSLLLRFFLVGIGAMSLCACTTTPSPASCPPTDAGSACFGISGPAFRQRAAVSAAALPELGDADPAYLDAPRVITGYELPSRTRIWVVPVLAQGRIIAASRFIAADQGRATLAETVALEEPLSELPENIGGEVVLWANPECRGDPTLSCLFPDYEWAVQLPGGNYRLFNGDVVESLPVTSPST